jgi:hypothetical protein
MDGEDFRIRKWDEDYEDNPYDILRVMLNYVDDDAGTALHLATKVSCFFGWKHGINVIGSITNTSATVF